MSGGMSYLVAENPITDLETAEAEVAELEDYIISDELYRTVIVRGSTGDEKIRMTGGDLLARLHRLQGEREILTPEQQERLDAAQRKADATIYSYKTRFHQRLYREIKARLDSLKWFLTECSDDPRRCRTEFPFEMRNRQRIEEILKQVGDNLPQDLAEALRGVDRRIRMIAQGSEFIWDPRVKHIYPPDRYWFLYMRP
ncbi:MAG TPA: hypothetical protein VNK95_01465 [Caldilineaceae bacterium]|nr:hypothetical protein [Caldilineaceae bacterium]